MAPHILEIFGRTISTGKESTLGQTIENMKENGK